MNEERKCLVCGKDISGRSLRTKYCSSYCGDKIRKKKYGEKNLRYDLQLKRDEIIKIKGSKCFFCESEINLQIHHKNYKNNELSNLVLLCAKCHRKLHEVCIKK